MTKTMTSETLSAYLDGELDTSESAEIEKAFAESQATRRDLEQLRDLNDLLSETYEEMLRQPISLDLASRVQREFDDRRISRADDTTERDRRSSWRHSLAASISVALVAAALAFAAGYFVSNQQHEARLAALSEQLAADRQAFEDVIALALEQRLSGETVDWENPTSGNRGAITPVRTFRNANGQWCREYREEASLGLDLRSHSAIACRTADGEWQTRLVAVDTS